jgi:cysteine synthase
MRCNNILEAVGRIPLIRLNRINQGLKPQMWIKAEMLNPGGSVKDRIGITMIDEAEKKGLLKPGGTIIEGTSGNTGMGLALVAAVRGTTIRAIRRLTTKPPALKSGKTPKARSRTSFAAWAPVAPSAALANS